MPRTKKKKEEKTGFNVYDLLRKQKDTRVACQKKFEEVFRVKFNPFWDGFLGFDVIKFDEEIAKPGEDESTRDAVLRQWGEPGVAILEKLLGIKPQGAL